MGYLDETREALAGMLRPGDAGANTATDHVDVVDLALEQLPRDVVERSPIVVRTDSAAATHDLCDELRAAHINFLMGYDLTETVRWAILELPESAWRPAIRQDGEPRPGAWVAEITDRLALTGWPQATRVIVRRERPHPAPSCPSPTTTAIASSARGVARSTFEPCCLLLLKVAMALAREGVLTSFSRGFGGQGIREAPAILDLREAAVAVWRSARHQRGAHAGA